MSDVRRDISGKVVFLSGASGGIGRELVRAFLDAGVAEIVAASRKPVASSDARVCSHILDVTDSASVAAAAAVFAERMDIMVNCAGANANSRIFLPPTLEGMREEMEVNYFGLLNMVRAFEVRDRFRGLNLTVAGGSPAEMGRFVRDETARWSDVIRKAGVTPQ